MINAFWDLVRTLGRKAKFLILDILSGPGQAFENCPHCDCTLRDNSLYEYHKLSCPDNKDKPYPDVWEPLVSCGGDE